MRRAEIKIIFSQVQAILAIFAYYSILSFVVEGINYTVKYENRLPYGVREYSTGSDENGGEIH